MQSFLQFHSTLIAKQKTKKNALQMYKCESYKYALE